MITESPCSFALLIFLQVSLPCLCQSTTASPSQIHTRVRVTDALIVRRVIKFICKNVDGLGNLFVSNNRNGTRTESKTGHSVVPQASPVVLVRDDGGDLHEFEIYLLLLGVEDLDGIGFGRGQALMEFSFA